MPKTAKASTKNTTKNTSAASSVSGKTKAIAKKPKAEKSTEFTKNIKMFRNQKEYFALDNDLKKW